MIKLSLDKILKNFVIHHLVNFKSGVFELRVFCWQFQTFSKYNEFNQNLDNTTKEYMLAKIVQAICNCWRPEVQFGLTRKVTTLVSWIMHIIIPQRVNSIKIKTNHITEYLVSYYIISSISGQLITLIGYDCKLRSKVLLF